MNWYKKSQINKKEIKLSPNIVKDFVDVFRNYQTKKYPLTIINLIQRIIIHAGNDIISDNAIGKAWRGKVDEQTIMDLKKVLDNEYSDAREFAKQKGRGSGFYIRKLNNIYNAFGISPSGETYDYKQEKWIDNSKKPIEKLINKIFPENNIREKDELV